MMRKGAFPDINLSPQALIDCVAVSVLGGGGGGGGGEGGREGGRGGREGGRGGREGGTSSAHNKASGLT